MSVHFGKEKFHAAMVCLVEAGDIHPRVNAALSQHLLHITENEDLPEKFIKDFTRFRESLGIDQQGHISEVINNKSESEVESIAKQIFSLYEKFMSC